VFKEIEIFFNVDASFYVEFLFSGAAIVEFFVYGVVLLVVYVDEVLFTSVAETVGETDGDIVGEIVAETVGEAVGETDEETGGVTFGEIVAGIVEETLVELVGETVGETVCTAVEFFYIVLDELSTGF